MHEPENFLKLVNSFKLGFLCKEGDLKFSSGNLLCSFDRLPGVLLELGNGGVQRVRLPLQGLHLLPDRIHRGTLLEKRYKICNGGMPTTNYLAAKLSRIFGTKFHSNNSSKLEQEFIPVQNQKVAKFIIPASIEKDQSPR